MRGRRETHSEARPYLWKLIEFEVSISAVFGMTADVTLFTPHKSVTPAFRNRAASRRRGRRVIVVNVF
jgi:hypothetical protein